jgi:hypothetical protein
MRDDRTVEVIRRLADEQALAPLSADELDGLLSGLPAVPRRRRFTGWGVAAAAMLAIAAFTWLGTTELPPENPAPSIADVTASPEPRRVEIRMATGDPSIQVVWVMSEDLEL